MLSKVQKGIVGRERLVTIFTLEIRIKRISGAKNSHQER